MDGLMVLKWETNMNGNVSQMVVCRGEAVELAQPTGGER